jgi:hypothetical protein
MTSGHYRLLVFFLAICPLMCAQSRWPSREKRAWKELKLAQCGHSAQPVLYKVGKYEIKLVSSADETYNFGRACTAYLIKPDGSESLLRRDAAISILKGTGDDIFATGNPGVILEAFSGGAHCCYTYVFAELGDTPAVLPPIENQTGFYIFKEPGDGRYKILTWDGGFDYFDDLCHACSPAPSVVLELHKTGLRDVSKAYSASFDEEITEARAEIKPDELSMFANADSSKGDPAWGESEELRQAILKIVLAYLYSGREQMAWQTLDQMWPAKDRQRIKDLILKTRSKGILSKIQAGTSTPGRQSSATR